MASIPESIRSLAPKVFTADTGYRFVGWSDGSTANPRTDSGHQQIQTQMPEVTQGAPEHDVVWVVDTTERFGEYVPYRDYDPRPVVGTRTTRHPSGSGTVTAPTRAQ